MKQITIKKTDEQIPIGKIVCTGRNYAEHAKELGNELPAKPVLFLKPASAVIYSGDDVVHPSFGNDLHHEVELLLLIGSSVKDASPEESENAIAGYGVGLDMTLRDVQSKLKSKGHPWTIAKCFDTSAVVSDFILKEDCKLSLDEKITLSVNSVIKQEDTLSSMIFKPAELVEYVSSVMSLEKGDLIFTGTPAGVSKVNRGDKLVGRVEGIAELTCGVK
jgi:5-carboxymethyl-2-hydroxymuconate isomerase